MMAPQIHIVFDFKSGPTGGGNQFLKALRKKLIAYELYSDSAETADVILFNSHQDIPKVINYKYRYKKKIFIHRIAGPIKLCVSNNDYRDDIVYLANKYLADGTIFQTEFSRRENYRMGLHRNQYEIIIPNASDPEIFKDGREKVVYPNKKIKLIATSWSANWNKGFKVYEWLDNNLEFSNIDMTFVGNSPIKFKNIRHIAPLKSDELANELRKHDIFITASKKDPCSNSLIEALSMGLPVIALRDGGHSELVKNGGELFDFPEEIPQLLERIWEKYSTYHDKIDVSTLDETVTQYVKFIDELWKSQKSGNYQIKKNSIALWCVLKSTIFWWHYKNIAKMHINCLK